MAIIVTKICDVCGEEGHIANEPSKMCIEAFRKKVERLEAELRNARHASSRKSDYGRIKDGFLL